MAGEAAKSKVSIDQQVTNLINRYAVIGGVFAAIVGAAWTIYAWDEVAVRESQKPFLEKQLQLYVETSKVAAKLTDLPLRASAGAAPEETWDGASRRFWELYRGELVVVADKGVADALVRFGKQTVQVESCRSRPEECRDIQARLKPLAAALAQTIRTSIEKSWGYKLPATDLN